jgi:hypothetical protein
MNPPSDRNRAIAARHAEGATIRELVAEFKLSGRRIREIVEKVEHYNRGIAILLYSPTSLEGLMLIGRIPRLALNSLTTAGKERLEDLYGMSLVDLICLPGIGGPSATRLIELCAEMQQSQSST